MIPALLFLLFQETEIVLVHEDIYGNADSAVSPDGLWMAFSSRRTGNADLWIADVKTGKARQLTKHAANDYEPRWHPDGKKILFTTERARNQDVYEIDIETGAERALIATKENEDYPSYSQDGKRIVFTGGPGFEREVYTKDLDSGKVLQITRGHRLTGATSFSPDGKQIVYHVYVRSYMSGESDLWLVSSEGGPGKKITDDEIWDYKACWAYHADWIAFSSKRDSKWFEVWIVKSDGTGMRKITASPGCEDRWPNWTKDGRIGFHRIVPAKGMLRRVEVETGTIEDVTAYEGDITGFLPSPDGTRAVWSVNNSIVLLNLENGTSRELTKGVEPRWSPDGAKLAFVRRKWTAVEAYVMPLDGEPVKVRNGEVEWPAAAPTGWSRDSKRLVLVAKGELVLDGKNLTKDAGGKSSPVWSADGKWVYFVQNRAQKVQYYLTKEPIR